MWITRSISRCRNAAIVRRGTTLGRSTLNLRRAMHSRLKTKTKKHLGQHLLVNANMLQSIANAVKNCILAQNTATLEVGDSEAGQSTRQPPRILEIGPGSGNLTETLLQLVRDGVARSLTAVEVDSVMIDALRQRFNDELQSRALIIQQQDVLQFLEDANVASKDYSVIVGNLPYNISSPILFRLMNDNQSRIRWGAAVFMFQKEFADRLTVS